MNIVLYRITGYSRQEPGGTTGMPVSLPPPMRSKAGSSMGRLSYVFVWVACLTRSSRISPEIHQKFTGISPEFL